MKRKLFNHSPNSYRTTATRISSGDAEVIREELRDIWKSFLSVPELSLFLFFFSGPLPAAHPHPKSPRGPRWHLPWLIYQHVRPPAAWPACVGVCSHARPQKKQTTGWKVSGCKSLGRVATRVSDRTAAVQRREIHAHRLVHVTKSGLSHGCLWTITIVGILARKWESEYCLFAVRAESRKIVCA